MKIIILIGHPAHVHMFKHFAHEMCKRNHNVLFVTLDKEFEIEYSHNIASYLSLQSNEDKIEELVRVIIPNIEYTKMK